MKIQRATLVFAIVFLVSLTACDTVSNTTPTPPAATATSPAASPTTAAIAATPTAVTAATPITNTAAPTSTPIVLDLPTVTPVPPTAAPPISATYTPSSAANTTPTTGSVSASSSELIFYLGNDGTIYTAKPDGSNQQPLLKVDIPAGDDVAGMSASVDGKYLAYELVDTATYENASYYLVSNGTANKLDGVASLPVWYGHRFVASGPIGEGITPGELAVYDADAAGGPSGAGLGVMGSNPTWYPDGNNILYLDALDNIYSIGANPPPYGNYTGTLLLHLNDNPADNNPDFFGTMFAAITPDSKTLVFGGEQIKNMGASGNGQRLWMYDLSKGPGSSLSAAQPFTNFGGRYGGNDNYGFANPNTLVVASDFHISACAVGSAIDVLGIGNAVTATVALPGQQGDSNARLYGISVAPANPNRANPALAYSLDNYTCADAGAGPTVTQAPTVYVWSGGQSSKVAAGRYPLWVNSSIAVAPAPTPITGESNPPTATPQSYNPSPTFGSGELIFYLASDGQTIDTMKPDGSDAGKLVTKVNLQPGEIITGLSASKDGKYLVYNLTLTAGTHDVTNYYLVANGKATRLSGIGQPPVWFANYFVAAAPTSSNFSEPTEIFRIFPDSANDPANFMIDSGVTGTLYTLFPDGTQLVYVDASGNIMALGLSHMTEHQPYTLVNLNPTAKPGDANFFQVDWMNFAPDGTLVFAGGKKSDIGPFGTGAKVWTHKLSDNSTAPPQPLSDTGRYDAYDFIGQTALVVNSAEHGGACGDIPHLKTLDFSSQIVGENPIPGNSPDGRYNIYGLSGAPLNPGRTSYAYSAEPYTCGSDNTPKSSGPSSIYVWTSANSATSTKIGEGRFPVWVDTNSTP